MSDTPTVTVNSVELDAQDFLDAVEKHEEGTSNMYVSGEVALADDGCRDDDVQVHRVKADGVIEQVSSMLRGTEVLEEQAQNAISGDMKVDYVSDIVSDVNTVLSNDDEQARNRFGDVEVHHGHMSSTEMEDLEDDDAITIAQVGSYTDDGRSKVNLSLHVLESEM